MKSTSADSPPSGTKIHWPRRGVRAVVVVALASGVTMMLVTPVLDFLYGREFCADALAMKGLVTLTILFAAVVWLVSLVPLPRDRRTTDAWALALVVTLVVWFPFYTHWPPISRGHMRRAVAQMREIADALENLRVEEGRYPALSGVAALNDQYRLGLPERDPWGQYFELQSDLDSYIVISYGDCGEPDVTEMAQYVNGPTSLVTDDIVLRDGRFLRYPEGIRIR